MSKRETSPIDESEWEAQERGMRAAPGGDAGGLTGAAEAHYRLVGRALVSLPRSGPPAGFAADVVKRIARHDAGLERLLSRLLLAAFLVASAFVGARYGEQWWQALNASFGGDALGWLLIATGCVGLSWMGRRCLELANHDGDTRHAL
jgi:hypothetical protein